MSPLNHLFCAQDSLLREKEIHHWQSSLHFPKLPSPRLGKLWHRGWTKRSLFLNHFMPLQEACHLQRSYSSAQSRSLPWSRWAEQSPHLDQLCLPQEWISCKHSGSFSLDSPATCHHLHTVSEDTTERRMECQDQSSSRDTPWSHVE